MFIVHVQVCLAVHHLFLSRFRSFRSIPDPANRHAACLGLAGRPEGRRLKFSMAARLLFFSRRVRHGGKRQHILKEEKGSQIACQMVLLFALSLQEAKHVGKGKPCHV